MPPFGGCTPRPVRPPGHARADVLDIWQEYPARMLPAFNAAQCEPDQTKVEWQATTASAAKVFLTNSGEADPAVMECREASGPISNHGRKGGVSWHSLPTARTAHTRPISPTSRRNSCAAVRITGEIMISWSGSGVADCGHPPVGGWLCHGASNFPIDPALKACDSPAIWQAGLCAGIVMVQGDADVMAGVASGAQIIVNECHTDAGHHLVLEEGRIRHRLFVTGPGCHRCSGFLLPDNAALPARMAALSLFHRSCRLPRSAAPIRHLHPTGYQRHRLELMLQVLDLISQDPWKRPSLRELARHVLHDDAACERAIEWKSSSARRRIQRIVADARYLMTEGYLELLACKMPKHATAHGI